MMIDRGRVRKVYDSYTAAYNHDDVKIRLKMEHTYRVAALSEKIAESLNLSTDDKDLAWLLGMLHDLGRFEQIRRYGTFEDAQSVNHAALSADLLFRDGLIRDYTGSISASEQKSDTTAEEQDIPGGKLNIFSRDQDLIVAEKAIRLHNVYALPKGLKNRERMFCQILRDADKIDILKVNCDIPLSEIYNAPEEEFRRSTISPEVLQDALSCRNVDLNHAVTMIDHLVSHMCLPYGLVYPESIRQVKAQGYLEKMLDFHSENPDTQQDMKKIRECMHQYIEERIRKNNIIEQGI